jgi:hypothetical protein
MVFIDSNVPMYVAGREHRNREPAQRFLESRAHGSGRRRTSAEQQHRDREHEQHAVARMSVGGPAERGDQRIDETAGEIRRRRPARGPARRAAAPRRASNAPASATRTEGARRRAELAQHVGHALVGLSRLGSARLHGASRTAQKGSIVTRSSHELDAIAARGWIGRDEPQLSTNGLRDEQAVERVSMMKPQFHDARDVAEIDFEQAEAVRPELLRHESLQRRA